MTFHRVWLPTQDAVVRIRGDSQYRLKKQDLLKVIIFVNKDKGFVTG